MSGCQKCFAKSFTLNKDQSRKMVKSKRQQAAFKTQGDVQENQPTNQPIYWDGGFTGGFCGDFWFPSHYGGSLKMMCQYPLSFILEESRLTEVLSKQVTSPDCFNDYKDVLVWVFINWSPYQLQKWGCFGGPCPDFDHCVVGTHLGHFPMLLLSKQGQFYQAEPRCFRRRLYFNSLPAAV